MHDGLVGIGGGEGGHDRDVIGIEQPLDFDRIEPGAAIGERRRNDLARARISAVALRTASALVRLSMTPPTSDLCTMSRDMILSTTVEPCAKIAFACATASSASTAAKVGTTAIS